jgi:hypothetical protein
MSGANNMNIGSIAFLGSGETSLTGGRVFELLARRLPQPLQVAILETPAGFELNSEQVAGRVGDFLKSRLQNFSPNVSIIPARKKGSSFSPDDPGLLEPLTHANLIFMGPGSPTYAARNLKNTLAWDLVRARNRLGAALVIASAATISAGDWVLPVYEIFKVGEDVHAVEGLGLFKDFGLHLSIIPHWNNAEGGADLDTSRCFVGMDRFNLWCDMLPEENTTLGLDEHTGLILDFEAGDCQVTGISTVSLVRKCDPEIHPAGAKFPIRELGEFKIPKPLDAGIRPEAWEMALDRQPERPELPPQDILDLARSREQARARMDFNKSDELRDRIAKLGWQVLDTEDGQKLVKE